LELLAGWVAAFNEDLKEPPLEQPELLEVTRRYVDRGGVFIWQDQQPVSLVNASGPAGRVARVGPVYTPPEFRRRGYAGAAVGAISRLLLDRGHPLCCLYTDRSNPTSNHIYQEVGYVPVCEVEEYWLQPA
jgi:predicted GNAT family acetyltransferase